MKKVQVTLSYTVKNYEIIGRDQGKYATYKLECKHGWGTRFLLQTDKNAAKYVETNDSLREIPLR